MECRPLEVTVISAKDLKNVNLFTKMDVYAAVSIKGHSNGKQKQKQRHITPVHSDSGSNPVWNYTVKFTLDEAALQQNRLTLKFKIKSDRSLGDRSIGEVRVPVKELLDAGDKDQKPASYSVRTNSGKSKGTLSFSFKFGDKFTAPVPEKPKKVDEHAIAYPAHGYPAMAGTSTAPYPAPSAYAPPPYGYAYPQQGAYPPPPQHAYPGYPPAPGYGYQGYPPQYAPQPGYGGYPMMQQPPQKPKKSGGNMALGLGAGLLGGLLVGDMISDIGDASAYDAGFEDGLDF